MNELAPHRAVINIKAEVYELLPNGQCTGRPDKKDSVLVMLTGKDAEEANLKLNQLMEKINEAIKNAKREGPSEG